MTVQLAAILGAPPVDKAGEYVVTAPFFVVRPDREQLAKLAALVESGRLHVEIAAMFPLAKGRAAFESGRRAGKTGIVVRD